MYYYLKLIKKYGIGKCIIRMFGNIFYTIVFWPYKLYAEKKAMVDNNKVLFTSIPSFSDNAKVFYDYLKKNTNLNFVWLIGANDILPQSDERTVFIRYKSLYHYGITLKALKEIMCSKYIFFTHGSPFFKVKKRQNQICVNLWHGCGYKDISIGSNKFVELNPFDYALVPGQVFVDTKQKFWGCKKEQILVLGYPRYDLFKYDDSNAHSFAESLKKDSQKLIIWMPTFRKTNKEEFPEAKIEYKYDIPLLNSDDDLKKLNELCKKNVIRICVKRHPYQKVYKCEKKTFSNIVFINNDDLKKEEIELYSLLKYTDALISDYSSVSVDYLLLNKPIAFSLDDYNDYKKTRGFVFENPLEYMPGYHLYELNDLFAFIKDIASSEDKYKVERQNIMNKVHNPCGNYCERIWNNISQLQNK